MLVSAGPWLLALSLAVAPAQADEPRSRTFKAVHERGNDCILGLVAWCLWEGPKYGQYREAPTATPRLRVEPYFGYKFGTSYYQAERDACDEAGCTLDIRGPLYGGDASWWISGDPYSDDFLDLSLHVGFLPVVSRFEQNPGFEGPQGPVAAGEGRAGYTIFRLGLRRSHYFYLVHSRYLIGGFGVGLAVPQTRGRAGASFTGMGSVRPTLGGKVGLEYPVNQHLRVGVASDWNVIWYGKRFVDSAFLTGYGLHVSALR